MNRWKLTVCDVCKEDNFTVTKCGGMDKTGCWNLACNECRDAIWTTCLSCGYKICGDCMNDEGICKYCRENE